MSYANKLSSYEHSFLLRATTAHAHAGDDPCRGQAVNSALEWTVLRHWRQGLVYQRRDALAGIG